MNWFKRKRKDRGSLPSKRSQKEVTDTQNEMAGYRKSYNENDLNPHVKRNSIIRIVFSIGAMTITLLLFMSFLGMVF